LATGPRPDDWCPLFTRLQEWESREGRRDVTDGLSDANREDDYTRDPVFGTCNNCGAPHCQCASDRIDALESALAEEKKAHEATKADLDLYVAELDHAFIWALGGPMGGPETRLERFREGLSGLCAKVARYRSEQQPKIGRLEAELAAERARTDALLSALPKCDYHPDRPATKSICRGADRFCDECGRDPKRWIGPYAVPDLPRAAPLRAILAARTEKGSGT
jgi:hypothetical protein